MSEKQRLLAAVCETPHDDAPRLVYSDWLEENGDAQDMARAEFIRVQLALAKLEEGDPARPPLVLRERELLDRNKDAWVKEVPAELGATELRRGFVERASMTAAAFMDLDARLWETVPLVAAGLTGDEDSLGRLAACPHLANLSRLSLASPRPVALARLLPSPRLAGLKALAVTSMDAARDELRALSDAGWPAGLDELDLSNCTFSLAEAPLRLPRGLASLSVRSVGLARRDAEGLAASLAGVRLRRLDASYNNLHDEGVADLLAVPGLAERLEELRLGRNQLGLAGIRAIAACRELARLRWLDIGVSHAGAPAMRLMAAASQLANLERLDMRFDFDELKDEGVIDMMRAPVLRNLRWFELSSNGIGPAGARAIAEAERPAGIWGLDLYSNSIGDEGVRALASSPHLRRLQSLNLYRNGAGREAVAELLRSENLRGALDLNLIGNTAGKAALEALCDGPVSPFANVALGKMRKSPPRDAVAARFGERLRFG